MGWSMLALRIHLYHHKGQKISVSEQILGVCLLYVEGLGFLGYTYKKSKIH
jgi:hypothetical protein